MENRRPISYTFEDIKRYRQGLMSKEEMHAFEKASMEDPFLADALEGYMEADMALAEEHLGNIAEKINDAADQKEKAVVVTMPKKSFAMWRVAAMIIVIAGAGLLTYNILNKKEIAPGPDGTIANIPADQQPAGSTATQNGSLTTDTNSTPLQFHASKEKTSTIATVHEGGRKPVAENKEQNYTAISTTINKKEGNAALHDMAKEDKHDSMTAIEEAGTKDVAAAPQQLNQNNANVNITNQFKGRVLTPANQPLANANIRIDNSNKQVVTDKSGSFVLNAPDTVVNATITSNGYRNMRVQLNSKTNNTISLGTIRMKNDPTYYDNIVVTGLGTAKKAKVADTTSAKPEGGWQSFKEHIARYLNNPSDTAEWSNDIAAGELEIEFGIDEHGAPRDIKVLKNSNAVISRQAIEAIKQGPKWSIKGKKARILIRF
jgi:hypothetical protein